jgi:hypothetical protein
MRGLMLGIVLLSGVGNAVAQERAPDRRDIVQQVSAADPARFACAHNEGRSCKNDWIKAVAWALHQTDARWGLNGKRGNAGDLSMDVVTWRIGPTDRHVQAFDICGACGGGSPSVVWSDITNWSTLGNPGTAIWIKPEPVGGSGSGGGGNPQPTPPPTPPAPVDLTPVLTALRALGDRLAALEAKSGVIDAAAHEALNAATRASDIKTLIENLPTSKPLPCLTGRVPKAFGGSTEVTFCPKE